MKELSKTTILQLNANAVERPPDALMVLPEKVLQFGTGVLLRALPDYFIDAANRNGRFNGRVVVVKSTDAGDTQAFDRQDGLYTLCIRGIVEKKSVTQNVICSAISRVLSAKNQWHDVLQCASNPELNVIISNTTEVGIQLVPESIFQNPPRSFPAKLLSFLYERFKKLGALEASKLVVLPTELITDNGKKLAAIVAELAHFNKLEDAFGKWLHTNVWFCNTLVDCIVPGKPEHPVHAQLEKELGYKDSLLTVSEVYRLWAIEGNAELKQILSFAEADSRIIIAPDITKFKELKLRLLNGTHTLSCGLAHLTGIATVKEAMEDSFFSAFMSQLMLHEIAPAVPYAVSGEEAVAFGRQVLDRFRNPHIQHRWLSISAQYSSKMAQRTVPVLLHYFELYKMVPPCYVVGFAAYLLFMKAVKKEGSTFWGACNGQLYPIQDDQAAYYFELWQQTSAEKIVHTALKNETAWGVDLSGLPGFESAVTETLVALLNLGAKQTLARSLKELHVV